MATNFVTASYQEIIDLHTESNTMSAIGIHTPNTDVPVKMLSGFWDQFRKVKYNGCSISLVPAARLPADPLQVSYEAGETTIDPRDMLNPILWHGCHGNDMGTVLNTLYNGTLGGVDGHPSRDHSDSAQVSQIGFTFNNSSDFWESLYYKALSDKTWAKAHPQVGFRKSGLRPLVHRVVANMAFGQFAVGPSTGIDPSIVTADGDVGRGSIGTSLGSTGGADSSFLTNLPNMDYPSVSGNPQTAVLSVGKTRNAQAIMTSRMEPLGWQDTHSVLAPVDDMQASGSPATGAAAWADNIGEMFATAYSNTLQTIPKVFMGVILLPPAYKTEQYYRLVINHSFAFRGFRGASMRADTKEIVNNASSVYNFN